MTPLVSVVVPAYNCGRFLRETVASILNQGVDDLEVLVVDDGSTDDTAEVARSLPLPVRLVQRANGGPGACRNTGMAAARGEYLAFLDGDDLWTPGSLRRRLEAIRVADRQAVMGLSHAFVRVPTATGVRDEHPFGDPNYGAFLSALLLRRSVVDVVGPFNEHLRISEDYDWLIRIRESGVEIVLLDDVVHLYRRHDTNITIGVTGTTSKLTAVLKQSLDRRRAMDAGSGPPNPMTPLTPDTASVHSGGDHKAEP